MASLLTITMQFCHSTQEQAKLIRPLTTCMQGTSHINTVSKVNISDDFSSSLFTKYRSPATHANCCTVL